MNLSKKNFGLQLRDKIKKKLTPKKIGEWAFVVYSDNVRDLDLEMHDIIQTLFMMEEGPEFEYSHAELEKIAELLIAEEKDILDKMRSNS